MSAMDSQKRTLSLLQMRRDSHDQEAGYFEDKSSVMTRIIIFFGIVVAITGICACAQATVPFQMAGDAYRYKFPGKLLLFSGSVLISTSIVTIIEASRLVRIATVCLLRGLSVSLFVETIAGSAALTLAVSISNGFFNESLHENLKEKYYLDPYATFTIDKIQQTLHCCGVRGPEDWKDSHWHSRRTDIADVVYPDTCCDKNDLCLSDSVNEKGCGLVASEVLRKNLEWTYLCSFISIFIHVTSYVVLSFVEKKL